MITIRGQVQQGQGKAKDTLREQMPYFAECFPEVAGCQPGTINILLEKPVVVLVPHFTTSPIPWHPGFKLVKNGEIFSFLRISLRMLDPAPSAPVRAWIYQAQFSPYRNNPFYAEVIASKLSFSGTPRCEITIEAPCQEGVVVMAPPDSGSRASFR